MKLFMWVNNRVESDFVRGHNAEFGNHSGCFIVLAENEEEAIEMMQKSLLGFQEKPKEIDLTKKGLVVYADGEC